MNLYMVPLKHFSENLREYLESFLTEPRTLPVVLVDCCLGFQLGMVTGVLFFR